MLVNKITEFPRFIPVQGSINFRDFGGYPAQGGNVKWGKLFRCGSLARLEPEGYEAFGKLNISVICDLRRDDEVELSPSPTDPPFDCRRHIPISTTTSIIFRESLSDPTKTAEDRRQLMIEITREFARDHHDEYRQLFECLVDAEEAFLLHCSAGKDRTGFGAALILTALGVDDDTIMEDYLLTNQSVTLYEGTRRRMREAFGDILDEESILLISSVQEEYLRAALEEVKNIHGSLDAYLEEIGVDARVKQALRERYVTA